MDTGIIYSIIGLVIGIIGIIIALIPILHRKRYKKEELQLELKANVLPIFQGILKELSENFEIRSFSMIANSPEPKIINNKEQIEKIKELKKLWVQLNFLSKDIFLDFEDKNFKIFTENLINFFGIIHKINPTNTFGGTLKNTTLDEETWQKKKEELINRIKIDFKYLQERIEEYLK